MQLNTAPGFPGFPKAEMPRRPRASNVGGGGALQAAGGAVGRGDHGAALLLRGFGKMGGFAGWKGAGGVKKNAFERGSRYIYIYIFKERAWSELAWGITTHAFKEGAWRELAIGALARDMVVGHWISP